MFNSRPTGPSIAIALSSALAIGLATDTHAATVLFSLDLGSDKEISDPLGGAGEELDPGDVHVRSNVAGTTATPWLDDSAIFAGADPRPQQGVIASLCAAGSNDFVECFDLDGNDNVDFRVSDLNIGDNPIYQQSIGQTACVHDARHLAISIDDDDATGMGAPAAPRAPTEGAPDHGTTAAFDEVFGVARGAGGIVLAAIADEESIHVDLGANPLPQSEDDDVDALDVTYHYPCKVHLFSADDEARLAGTATPLLPGSIYQYDASAGGAPTAVIDTGDLGIAPATDVDGFELAWLRLPQSNQRALALLFSVDEDRPGTASDESGGLDPGAVYYSFMTGSSDVLIPSADLPVGDVDAIAVSRRSLTMDTDSDLIFDGFDNCIEDYNPGQIDADGDGLGNVCDADFSNDCTVGFPDLALFQNEMFGSDPVFDLNGDAVVNFGDVAIMKARFFRPPGPSAGSLCD